MSIDERLKNWSRYYRTRIIFQACGSAEKYYRAPWRQWISLSDIQHSEPIDVWDAQEVEKAWRLMLGRHKLLLKYTYMSPGMPDWMICRKSGIKRWRLETELARSKRIIKTILDNFDAVLSNDENLIPRTTRENAARWEGRSFSEKEQA